MRHTGFWKLWTWVAMFLLPASICVTVREKPETTCPILRMERNQDDRNRLQVSGFDLAESFALRRAFCEGDKICFKLGSALLLRDTSKIFPKGLPEEYSVAVIFRVRRSTKKERWFLWQILNQQNMPQISIVIDGTKKVVEFMFRGADGGLLNYVFKNRELRLLFDRQWHKLGIGVQSRVLSLYMDCNLVASRHTEEKDSVDFHGKTVIAARASDGKPVDIELHQLIISCSANFLAEESCCDIATTKCSEQDDFGSTTPSWVTSHTGKTSSHLSGSQELKDLCQCIPNKEEAGSPGTPGYIGHKGDKGEPGENGLHGIPGLLGQKGEQGLEGIKGETGEKSSEYKVHPNTGLLGNYSTGLAKLEFLSGEIPIVQGSGLLSSYFALEKCSDLCLLLILTTSILTTSITTTILTITIVTTIIITIITNTIT
ncbi:collagen alpha-1(XIX) chain-like [Phodopus roborovskii]|uniref:collagen alpha-1(XIX) chain-like n=1 Tax=Phodopus roborovskii TaxID=109678 RepID=UPI0021E4B4FE|nr:collagen alpha-1(XIX) chain-like [Phodopus roborovskii]